MTDAPHNSDEDAGLVGEGKLSADDAASSEQRRNWLRAEAVSSRDTGGYGDLKQNLTNHWKVQER